MFDLIEDGLRAHRRLMDAIKTHDEAGILQAAQTIGMIFAQQKAEELKDFGYSDTDGAMLAHEQKQLEGVRRNDENP